MRLRPWQPADFSAVADFTSEVNVQDPLVRYFTKDIFAHWDAYRSRSTRWIRNQTSEPGVFTVVVETEPGDQQTTDHVDPHIPKTHRQSRPRPYPPGSVIACATWKREGTSKSAQNHRGPNAKSWCAWLERSLQALEA